MDNKFVENIEVSHVVRHDDYYVGWTGPDLGRHERTMVFLPQSKLCVVSGGFLLYRVETGNPRRDYLACDLMAKMFRERYSTAPVEMMSFMEEDTPIYLLLFTRAADDSVVYITGNASRLCVQIQRWWSRVAARTRPVKLAAALVALNGRVGLDIAMHITRLSCSS